MKTLFIFFILIILSSINLGQDNSAPPVELFFITEGAPSSPIINFTLTAQSQCWGDTSKNSNPPGYGEYFLTDDFDEVTYVPQANNMGSGSAGFEFITSNAGANSPYPVFAYGLYKVTSNGTNKYFYLDYRDYRIGYYSSYSPPTNGHNIDLWIKYRYDQDVFYYSSTGSANDFHSIESGQLLNFWDIKQKGQQLTSLFPDYWENCLALIPSINNHPKLVWGPYPDDNFAVQYYKIYKKKGSSTFTVVHTTSDFTWVDASEIMIFGPPQSNESICYYKISAVGVQRGSSVETGVTNTVDTRVQGSNQEKVSSDNWESKSNKFTLSQNYPNPFNPGTIINYTVAANSLVTIKVYDILGNEVAELVNSNKVPGNYSVSFDASGLSSGLYLYQLKAGGYSITKKMLVAK
jgi:hypothetical protein